ncbi:MAG: type IV pilus assembly protein PilM [Bdellovibrionota bacterium]|nr:MAG: type IV pilus assembly protein PilM [Bdellovibrionota bacterium]
MGISSWLSNLVRPAESLVAVDIGASSIKLLEMDCSTQPYTIVDAAIRPTPADCFNGYVLSRPEKVAEELSMLLSEGRFAGKRVAMAMPAPAVFTKRIKTARMKLSELRDNIVFEARNVIPHNIEAVSLDFHVIGSAGKGQLDVLVAAVKNEVLDSYMAALSAAGLGAGVVDVDYFAVQNAYELSSPDSLASTVVLIHMGHRYSSIGICRNGEPMFNGDIQVGTKMLTDALVENLGVTVERAEEIKRSIAGGAEVSLEEREALSEVSSHIAFECNRQLSFFWNASGADSGIERILISGGGALFPDLVAEVAQKTGIETSILQPQIGLTLGDNVNQKSMQTLWPLMSVVIGLAFREPGDQEDPEIEE